MSVARHRLLLVPFLALAACGGESTARAADASGLATAFDSSAADTVVARVAGEVPAEKVRALREELRIQPGAEDTSLFSDIYMATVDAGGRMYVADENAKRIHVFDTAGTVVRVIGRQGGGPGEFDGFNGIAILPDGRLVVLDVGNARVSFFRADGSFETSWRVPGGFFSNEQLRTDSSGAIYMVQPLGQAGPSAVIGMLGLVRLGPDGETGDSLLPPDLGAKPISFIAEQKGGRSQMFATYSPRNFWAWHRDGYFVNANGGLPQFVLGRPARPVRVVRDAPVVPVGDDENAAERERITFSMRRIDPSWSFSGDLPTTKAPIVELRTTRDGRVWVGVATPTEPIPEAEREEQRPNAAPVRRFRSPAVFEVYDASGRFAGRVAFPPRSRLVDADGDRVWLIVRDGDGLPGIARFRVTPGF